MEGTPRSHADGQHRRYSRPLLLLVAVFMGLPGLVMLVAGVCWYFSTRSFVNKSIKTTGTVIDVVYERSSSKDHDRDHPRASKGSYFPIVRFQAQNEETIEFRSSVGTNPPSYTKGQQVDVLYDPKNPKDAAIGAFTSLWFGPTLVSVLGVGFVAVGIVVVYLAIRQT